MGQYKPTVMINRPNFLARKVDKLAGVSADALIARTQSMVKEEAAGFVDWVRDDLDAIKAIAGELAGGVEPQGPHIARIFRGAADIRDQGTVCGYPLVTRIAGLLCDFVDRAERLDQRETALVVAHADALLTIVAARIKNERSKLAKKLVADLESAAAKLRQ
ncbi:MAG: hypothetical protein ACTSUD_09035 [Alphaproteobacteria bacterium]